MDIKDILAQTGGLQSMAQELGIDEAQASSGTAALLPAILGGFKKQAQSQSGGLEGLGGMLGKLGGSGLLENVLSSHPTDVSQGNNVLAQIFGSKDVSRAVSQQASTRSGVDPATLKKMLPMVAMMVAGYMASHKSATQAQAAAQPKGGLSSLLGGIFGGGSGNALPSGTAGLAKMIDMDGDGNPLDDIMKMMGKNQG
ncbi:MAG TPA: DUF937 domain-containing protein [Candidatus Krumholzibacteria bacterium]|nr:DUF937 domain-containing protein [Candidatus Krumholzibacteria bacterium]